MGELFPSEVIFTFPKSLKNIYDKWFLPFTHLIGTLVSSSASKFSIVDPTDLYEYDSLEEYTMLPESTSGSSYSSPSKLYLFELVS